MASDKGKTKGSKAASKKGKPKMKWGSIIIITVLVLTLVGMVVAQVVNSNWGSKISTDTTNSLVQNFNDIEDSLHILPFGASYVRYVDMNNDTELGNYMRTYYSNTFPPSETVGANAVRDSLAVYPAGYFGDLQTSR